MIDKVQKIREEVERLINNHDSALGLQRMSEKVKHCGTCDNAKWFWAGCRREHRQYYCQLKLQRERQSSTGNERNAYIKYRDVACDEYINYNED